MIYHFEQTKDRHHSASIKWEQTKDIFGEENLLPMWVADMDFEPPKEVHEALKKRIEHGIYGYTFVPESTTNAIVNWLKKRHDWTVDPSWILYNTGVVPSISTAIQAFTEPGDKILLQTPVYAPFMVKVKLNNRVIVNSPLQLKNNRYEINFTDFEEKLKQGVKLFLLCNPHNPGGRVWTIDELKQIADLCIKYNCLIISDEIHSDLVYKPNKHIPIASIDEKYKDHVITFIAPSKTFNIAGLQTSSAIIPNQKLSKKFELTLNKLGYYTLNTFGIFATEAAYLHGEEWLEQLLDYLKENIKIAQQFIEKEIPQIEVMKPDATYLLWLNCRKMSLSDEEIKNALIHKGKLALEPGPKYGPGGEGFVRMNIACGRNTLHEGLQRLKQAFAQ